MPGEKIITNEERLFIQNYLNRLYKYYGRLRRIERMAPMIAAVVWKIYQIARPSLNLVREITFYYDGCHFMGRYIRSGRGHLEIVEIVEHQYERTVCIITNLVEAITLDLKKVLDNFLRQKCTEPVLDFDSTASSAYRRPENYSDDSYNLL